MSPPVLFEGVWKKFRRGERHDSLRDLVPAMARGLVRRPAASELREQEFWALRDVSFAVERGEAFGIIGPNGAGKSTTLKLLTRILKPTRGHCEVRGRVGALIEVAAGFHPDLTGRENVYLQGAIMGMKRAEIARQFDAIVEFAGLSAFIDTPVKRYSSGMNARLGFSIAAHLEPEVLIIDEVLSVGDMAFQQRCVERMGEFKRQGVSIVFVSHNLQAVAQLCDRAVYLDGEVVAHGASSAVIDAYVNDTRRPAASQSAAVEIVRTTCFDSHGAVPAVVQPGAHLTLRAIYEARESIGDLTFGFIVLRSTDRLLVYDGNIRGSELGIDTMAEGQQYTIDFHFRAHLTRGHYFVDCHVFHNPTHRFLCRIAPAATLSIEETRTHGGVADLQVRTEVCA